MKAISYHRIQSDVVNAEIFRNKRKYNNHPKTDPVTKPQKKEEILDNSGTNVVVNSGGSEVTITIRKVGDEVKNKQELRRHELPVNMEIDNN